MMFGSWNLLCLRHLRGALATALPLRWDLPRGPQPALTVSIHGLDALSRPTVTSTQDLAVCNLTIGMGE